MNVYMNVSIESSAAEDFAIDTHIYIHTHAHMHADTHTHSDAIVCVCAGRAIIS